MRIGGLGSLDLRLNPIMAARKFTAALFEHVDYKAQAAEIAKKEEAKQQQQKSEQRLQLVNSDKSAGILNRIFSRSTSDASTPKEAISATSSAATSSAASSSAASWPRVLLFGDSLTQYAFGTDGGWAAMLAEKLQRKADVVNRGFSGYNSRWCRVILDQVK